MILISLLLVLIEIEDALLTSKLDGYHPAVPIRFDLTRSEGLAGLGSDNHAARANTLHLFVIFHDVPQRCSMTSAEFPLSKSSNFFRLSLVMITTPLSYSDFRNGPPNTHKR